MQNLSWYKYHHMYSHTTNAFSPAHIFFFGPDQNKQVQTPKQTRTKYIIFSSGPDQKNQENQTASVNTG